MSPSDGFVAIGRNRHELVSHTLTALDSEVPKGIRCPSFVFGHPINLAADDLRHTQGPTHIDQGPSSYHFILIFGRGE